MDHMDHQDHHDHRQDHQDHQDRHDHHDYQDHWDHQDHGIIMITGIIRITGITRITGIIRIIGIIVIDSITRITRRQRQCPCGPPRELRGRRQDRPAGQWTGRIQQRTSPQRRLFYRYRERDTGSWWIPDRQLRHYHADSTRLC